jgi:uncharacterized protein
MPLQVYASPTQFLELARPLFEAHESENNLIFGVSLRLVEHPEWIDTPIYLAAALDERGKPGLAASISSPNNILLAVDPAISTQWLHSILGELVQNLLASGWQVPGVLAESSLARQFSQVWAQAAGLSIQENMRERIYELREVTPPSHSPAGYLRPAGPADLDRVADWHLAFTQEALGQGSLEESRKTVARRVAVGDIFLWEDRQPVSMAFRARPTPHGCTVTGVYTPPDLRGHGYASACVAALSQRLLDSGKLFCNLFTDLANPTSNSIYQKIGYQPVCDFTEYCFGES